MFIKDRRRCSGGAAATVLRAACSRIEIKGNKQRKEIEPILDRLRTSVFRHVWLGSQVINRIHLSPKAEKVLK